MFISNIGSISTIINLATVLVNFNGTESMYHINLSKPQSIFNSPG
ncbi:MAG: hypothetical protein WB392_10775 [Methanotrichaceae archaeon]